MPPHARKPRKKKVCNFCADKILYIDFKEFLKLRRYLTDRGKVLPRRITGNCAKHQRNLTLSIKRARQSSLLPFVSTEA